MLNKKQIEKAAKKAGEVAYSVLGLECKYTIVLINDPEVPEDARLDTTKNEIQINLAQLEPFSPEAAGIAGKNLSDEAKLCDEDYRHFLKICYLVFHEMRHIYQKEAATVYMINKMLGSHSIPPLEPDKKAAQWLDEMMADNNTPPGSRDTEADANDFAYYLTNRYPLQLRTAQTNRRIGAMKRKYDKIPIPE